MSSSCCGIVGCFSKAFSLFAFLIAFGNWTPKAINCEKLMFLLSFKELPGVEGCWIFCVYL